MAVYHLATSLAARGQHDECERLAEAAAEQARALGLLREQAFLFGALGFSASRRGQAHQAMQYEQRVAPMLRALGDRRNEAISLSNQAVYWGNVGRFERATEVYGEALALARANGDRVIQLSTQLALVQMEFEQGRFEAVRQPYRALLAEAERIDARDMVVEIHTRLARAHLACQDWDAAQRSLEQAFAEADEVDPSLRGNLLALQAALAAGLGRFDEARSRLGALLDAGTDTHWEQVAEPLEAAWLLADVLRTLGDPRAGTVARQACELLRQRASALPEDDREGYLQAVHLHHALLAWA